MAKIEVEVSDNVMKFLTNLGALVGVDPKTMIEQEIKTLPTVLIENHWTEAFYASIEDLKRLYNL